MNHTNPRFKDQDPWDAWSLEPHVPDPRPSILVLQELATGDCVSPSTEHKRTAIEAATAHLDHGTCSARMHYHEQRRRGRFGVRSPLTASKPCSRRAVIDVLYTDGTTASFCKEHSPM